MYVCAIIHVSVMCIHVQYIILCYSFNSWSHVHVRLEIAILFHSRCLYCVGPDSCTCLLVSLIYNVHVHVFCLFSQDKTHLTAISSFQKDIMTILPSHYNTFVDVMEFHDLVLEVVTSLATVQFIFDIVSTAHVHVHAYTINYDMYM